MPRFRYAVLLLLFVSAACKGKIDVDIPPELEECIRNPEWCREQTPTPTPPAPTATPGPAEPTRTPTPSPSPQPTETPKPQATSTPTPAPTPQPSGYCKLSGAPWLLLNGKPLPQNPVPVERSGPCPLGLYELKDPYTGRRGCSYDWPCAPGQTAMRPLAGAQYSMNQQSVSFMPSGMTRDTNESSRETDAFGRQINADGSFFTPIYRDPETGELKEEKWWVGACDPVECNASATPGPTATPQPSGSCQLPQGEGSGVDCPRTTPRHLELVDQAIQRVINKHPEWFRNEGRIVNDPHQNDFRYAVVAELRLLGACAFFDGEEVALKLSNEFSEQYHVLSSADHVRRGEGSYRATCTPAWSAIPRSPTAQDPPLLVLWRAGDKCHNPKNGPKYQNGLCLVDSTPWFRDPAHPEDREHDSSCDIEHIGWLTFCNQQNWLDSRGPERSVTGSHGRWWVDDENPAWTWVEFEPGQSFMLCTKPYADVNFNGIPIPTLGPAQQCKQVSP